MTEKMGTLTASFMRDDENSRESPLYGVALTELSEGRSRTCIGEVRRLTENPGLRHQCQQDYPRYQYLRGSYHRCDQHHHCV